MWKQVEMEIRGGGLIHVCIGSPQARDIPEHSTKTRIMSLFEIWFPLSDFTLLVVPDFEAKLWHKSLAERLYWTLRKPNCKIDWKQTQMKEEMKERDTF